MSEKILDTVVQDVYDLFNKGHEVSQENLDSFAKNVTETIRNKLKTIQTFSNPTIRMSKIGTPDRKLWYEFNIQHDADKPDPNLVEPANCIKFLYGDIIEELLLLLIKESGHKVEGEQGEVEVEGVVGHRDCIIDGITVDIKSTSKYAFQKFEKGTLHQDDPFAYIAQISGYAHADDSPYGAFIAMNKETGELALLKIDKMDMIDPVQRVREVRDVIEREQPPEEKCYPEEPMGKTGNMTLAMGCSFCPFKELCWADANGGQGLRKFRYSNGDKYLTKVVNEPRVEEVFDNS